MFARRHLASPGNTVDHPDPGCANRIAEGYLHPDFSVCSRRRAISCTRRHCVGSRTGGDTTATAYTNVELPGSDPPAFWPRNGIRGTRRDSREDSWRDPCNMRRIAGIRPSPWCTVDDGTCGPGVNAGELRIDRLCHPSAQRPERLAGPVNRAYTGSLHTQAVYPMSRSHLT